MYAGSRREFQWGRSNRREGRCAEEKAIVERGEGIVRHQGRDGGIALRREWEGDTSIEAIWVSNLIREQEYPSYS